MRMDIHAYYKDHNYAMQVPPVKCMSMQMKSVNSVQYERALGHACGVITVQSSNVFPHNTPRLSPHTVIHGMNLHTASSDQCLQLTLSSGYPIQGCNNINLPFFRHVVHDQNSFVTASDIRCQTGGVGVLNSKDLSPMFQDNGRNDYKTITMNKSCGGVFKLVPLQQLCFVPGTNFQTSIMKNRLTEKVPRKVFGEHFMNITRHETTIDGVSGPKKSRKQKARPKVTGTKSDSTAKPAKSVDANRVAHEDTPQPVTQSSDIAQSDCTLETTPTSTTSSQHPTTKSAPPPSKSKCSHKQTSTKVKKRETEPQQPITDFFPIRRSGRRYTSRELKNEKEKELHQKILSCCEEGLEVVDIEGKGRGVVAARNFERDEFIVEYAGELVNITTAKQRESLYELDEQVGCYMYYFIYQNKQYCVDATAETGKLGRLLNHSRRGNCHTKVVPVNSRPYLVLVASRDIEKGEELTYDYGDRSQTAIQSHPWLKL